MASPQIKSAPHPSGVDLCPLERWNVALHVLLSRLRNGTLERAGGYMALLSEYEKRFSGHRCTHLAPANGPDFASSLVGVQGWPPSRRSSAASVRPPLLIGMGDGTTGTRFLACVFRMLKMETYHNDPYPKESVSLTAWFDAFAAVLDSPIPYMLDALLATHAANETALFITVRDPWDWVRSRRAHHLPEAEHWSASTGGCGTNGVLIGRDETSNDEVARNLLVEWVWATCVATQRDGRPPPILNLFDDDQCTSALTMKHAMRRPWVGAQQMARAWGSCGQDLHQDLACPLWNISHRSRRRRR